MLLPVPHLSILAKSPKISTLHLFIPAKSPKISTLPFLAASARLTPLAFTLPFPMAPLPEVVAEYAKSGRSTCKKCSKAIAAGTMRVGLSSKDPRGFHLVKWYHLDCFPTRDHPLAAAEKITGFSSLKSFDQDALRKLEATASSEQTVNEIPKIDCDPAEELKGSKKQKVGKRDGSAIEELEENNSKKLKSTVDGKKNDFKMAFSASDIKDRYKDATLSPKWKAFKTLIFREWTIKAIWYCTARVRLVLIDDNSMDLTILDMKEEGLRDSEKIAAFDFDGCLVNTSVKRIGPDAWSLMYPSVPEKLQGLYNSGYKLVIFTNESNIERWKKKRQQAVDSKIGRLDNFIKHVKVPIQVFIACGLGTSKDQTEDPFRKPKPEMWRLMEKHFNSGIAIDMDQSFYVGDAAGRVNDHSDADIKFAQAVGLKFHVPEEFFGS